MNYQVTLERIAVSENVSVIYSDEDLIIIDDLKTLAGPVISRFDCNSLTMVLEGQAKAKVGDREVEFCKNQLLILPPNVTLTDLVCSPDFTFKTMFFTTRLLQSYLRDKIALWNEMVYVRHSFLFDVDEQGMEYFQLSYAMLSKVIASDDLGEFKAELIHSMLRPIFLGLCIQMKVMAHDKSEVQPAAADSLFHRFLLLLNGTDKKHRSVESYAAELCVSPKYLSSVCKRNSGKTANEWITEHVMEDLRYYLCHTDHSIKEICTILGFPNPSFFGKYVKLHFGVTPIQLRGRQK